MIRASVNTVKLIGKHSELKMEKELTEAFKRPVDVHLEQVIVASDKALKQQKETELMPVGSSPAPRADTTAQTKSNVEQMVMNAQRELTETLAPFPVSDTRLTFASGTESLQVSTTLKRDYLVEEDERQLLTRIMERSLGLPVVLTVKTIPLLPPLLFDDTGALTSASAATLFLIKQLPGGSGAFRFVLESSTRKNAKRLEAVKQHLIEVLGVPDHAVMIHTTRSITESAGVTLRMVR